MGGALAAPVKIAQSLGVVSAKPSPAAVAAPTTAEVSQSSATSAMETETLKKRRRGKSPTILTSASGVEQGATLGTTSLLGQ
jgi:hypothetical protein